MASSRLPVWFYSAIGSVALAGAVASIEVPAAKPAEPQPAAASPTGGPPAVGFDATTALVLDRRDSDGNPTGSLILKNDASKEQDVSLTTRLVDRNGCALTGDVVPDKLRVAARDMTSVSISIRQLRPSAVNKACTQAAIPARGYLVAITAGDKPPVARALRIEPPLPSSLQNWIVLGALAVALVSVLAFGLFGGPGKRRDKWGKVWNRLGPASWADSWGSNTALGASLLTALLGLTVFPEQTHFLHKKLYTVLSVLFAAFVGLAPVIYAAWREPANDEAAASQAALRRDGYVAGFLVAAVLTLWGATGQLFTVLLAVAELRDASIFPTALSVALFGLVAILLLVLLIYGSRSVRALIHLSTPAPASGTSFAPGAEPPGWSLL